MKPTQADPTLDNIKPVCSEAAKEYRQKMHSLAQFLDNALDGATNRNELLGCAPIDLLRNNHKNHVHFLANVFELNDFELLKKTIPWVYGSYHSHGVPYDYFRFSLQAWQEAVKEHLTEKAANAICPIYQWMLEHHGDWQELAENRTNIDETPAVVEAVWAEKRSQYLDALLRGKSALAMEQATSAVKDDDTLRSLYLSVLQPSLYEVGSRWEKNEISVAHEHLATSITGRVMAHLQQKFVLREPSKGRAIVTSAPDEYHAIGAWMVADFLALDGWDVAFVGANTPANELIAFMIDDPPDLLLISVTMATNLDKARILCEQIRNESKFDNLRIAIGGRAIGGSQELCEKIGAHVTAADAQSMVEDARQWWSSR